MARGRYIIACVRAHPRGAVRALADDEYDPGTYIPCRSLVTSVVQ